MSREDFVWYLENTLIPDLKESGHTSTAADFEAAILFINGAEEVEIDSDTDSVTKIK